MEQNKKYESLIFLGAILGCVAAVLDLIFTTAITHSFQLVSLISDGVIIVCLVFLVKSYLAHDKNLMNMMAGALMMALVLLQNQYTSLPDAGASGAMLIHGICDLLLLAVLLAAFLNHIRTTFHHNRQESHATLGLALLFVAAALSAVQIAVSTDIGDSFSFVRFMNWASWYCMELFILVALVGMELQLNVFKIEKEKKAK